MALWNPPDNIGDNEPVGRRIFQRPSLKGAEDQPLPPKVIELYHFQEGKGSLSLDRLGQTSTDARVKRWIDPIAKKAAASFRERRAFKGWFVVRARDLRNPPQGTRLVLTASPIVPTEGDQSSANPYHGHIETPAIDRFHYALQLKYVFESKYQHEPELAEVAASPTTVVEVTPAEPVPVVAPTVEPPVAEIPPAARSFIQRCIDKICFWRAAP